MSNGILICGLGPGDFKQITEETIELLFSGRPVFLRTAVHPSVQALKERDMVFTAFDTFYESENDFETVYSKIVEELIEKAQQEEIIYAVPGHPICGESTVQGLIQKCKEKNIPYHIYPAVSFIDVCMTAVERDPVDGLTVLDALTLHRHFPPVNHGILITQVYNPHIAGEIKLLLGEKYDDEMMVALISADVENGTEKVEWLPLYEIDRENRCCHLTTLYVPEQKNFYRHINALTHIMAQLRAPDGCPWDRAQTHESLRKYLLEETYEALDAIDREDIDNLIEELGDLLYQIVFHAEIGKENGYFNFDDVVEGICLKMIRRHPHVFGDVKIQSETELNTMWERIKKDEKKDACSKASELNVPKAFPALVRAEKLIKIAVKSGLAQEDSNEMFDTIQDELAQLKQAIEEKQPNKACQLTGNLLLAICRLSFQHNIDAELALKDCLADYEKSLCESYSVNQKNS